MSMIEFLEQIHLCNLLQQRYQRHWGCLSHKQKGPRARWQLVYQIHLSAIDTLVTEMINAAKYLNGFPSAAVQSLRNEEQCGNGTNRPSCARHQSSDLDSWNQILASYNFLFFNVSRRTTLARHQSSTNSLSLKSFLVFVLLFFFKCHQVARSTAWEIPRVHVLMI